MSTVTLADAMFELAAVLDRGVDEFAATRSARLTEADTVIRPHVEAGLVTRDWDGVLDAAGELWQETYGESEDPDAAFERWMRFRSELAGSLEKTQIPDGAPAAPQVERVTKFVATAAVNDATFQHSESAGGRRLRWVSQNDEDVRSTHQVVDGQIRQLGQPFDVGGITLRYPGDPLGPPAEVLNCFPATVRVEGRISGAARRWYSGPMVEVETGGQQLTGTPNHPVLTQRGWVRLGEIERGDHLVTYRRQIEPPVGHDVDDMPAMIGEVFDAFEQVGPLVRVRGSRVDFHGDGLEAEIEVVGAYSLLGDDGETLADQVVRQLAFPLTDANLGARECLRSVEEFALAGSSATPSFVGGAGVGGVLLGGAFSGEQSVGRGSATNRHFVADEERPERYPATPGSLSEGLLGLAGEVALDPVVGVRRIEAWDGHVYNLSTSTGAYSCNGFIVHNCRCLLRPIALQARRNLVSAAETTVDPDLEEIEIDDMEPLVDDQLEIPWHAVLAPEEVVSGDGRMFAAGAVTWRDLPLPLLYQHATSEGHGGSVRVGRIDEIDKTEAGLVRARGVFNGTPEAQDVIAGIVDGSIRGVSVDVDNLELDFDRSMESVDDMYGGNMVFSKARVAGLTIVAIPAFQEAYIELGGAFEDELTEEDWDTLAACGCQGEDFRDVSTEERKRLADENKAMPDGSYPIADCEDLRNAIQAIGRASNPDEVKAHIRRRKSALGCEDVELPESWALTAAVGTKDGPGWITNPRATSRIRRYWTHGEGAAKIRWGAPGDFNRCRNQLAKYIANPEWLAGTCANMHKEALGVWPGVERGGRHELLTAMPAVSLASPIGGRAAGSVPSDASPGYTPGVEASVDAWHEPHTNRSTASTAAVRSIAAARGLDASAGLASTSAVGTASTSPTSSALIAELSSSRDAATGGKSDATTARPNATASFQRPTLANNESSATSPSVSERASADGQNITPTATTPTSSGSVSASPASGGNISSTSSSASTTAARSVAAASASSSAPAPSRTHTSTTTTTPAKYADSSAAPATERSGASKTTPNFSGGRSITSHLPQGSPIQSSEPILHLVAGAGSRSLPRAEWFSDPHFAGPSPITIDVVDGAILFRSHVATWGVCHIGIQDVCTTAPHSVSDYAYFRVGAVETDEGLVPVGHITMGTGHAALNKNASATLAHYDNTGTVIADVAAGEDAYGIWVAGVIRPGADEEAIAALQAASLSGDWRLIRGQLELVAALAVNVPGFPIPRVGLAASAGTTDALVATGVVLPAAFSSDAERTAAIARTAVQEYVAELARREALEERAARVRANVNAARVAALREKVK